MGPKSTPKPSDSDKKHLTQYTQNLYPKLLILGSNIDSKMMQKSIQNRSRSNRKHIQKPAGLQSRLWGGHLDLILVSVGPPAPHFFEQIRDFRMYLAKMFEKTPLFLLGHSRGVQHALQIQFYMNNFCRARVACPAAPTTINKV